MNARTTRALTLSLLAGTALSLPLAARAQEATALDEIVIYYGALEPRDENKTAQAVTVISKSEMEKTGETRLAEIFARMPGVGVVARGPMGTQSGLTIRGLSQNYIKVLVDGIDVSDPSTPQVAFDFGRLYAPDYNRVELIRGSQSAVLGSTAVGGAVVLDSWRPEKEGLSQQVTVEGGSMNTLGGAYSFGYKKEDTELAMTLSKVRTSGYSAADEKNGNTEDDGYDATRLSLSGQTRVGEGLIVGFSAFAQNDRTEIDSAFGTPIDSFDTTKHRERGARVFAQFATGAFDHEISATYFSGYRAYTSDYGPYDYRGTRRTLNWKTATDVAGGRLSFGLDRTLEDYEGTYVTGTVLSSRTGVYGEYAFAPAAGVDVVASVRHDENSTYGGKTTGRIGATWALSDALLLRSSLATGFRAPSGYELYDPWAGNPDLVPETSRSFDLGLEKTIGDTRLRATLFRIDTDNLIDYVSYVYTQVPGTTKRQGVELEATGRIGGTFGYSVNYTYLDWSNPDLDSSSSWNTSFGRHTLAATLDTELTRNLTGAISLRYVADRQSLPDYGVVDAKLTYDLGEGREVWLRAENLLDKHYELWPGYGTSGRAVYVGLSAKF